MWNIPATEFREVELYVVPLVCMPLCDQHIELAQKTYKHLVRLELADSSDGEVELQVDLLIGADIYWEFVTNKMVAGNAGPVALETMFGWVLIGRMDGGTRSTTNFVQAHVMSVVTETDDQLNDLVQNFGKLTQLGCRMRSTKIRSKISRKTSHSMVRATQYPFHGREKPKCYPITICFVKPGLIHF